MLRDLYPCQWLQLVHLLTVVIFVSVSTSLAWWPLSTCNNADHAIFPAICSDTELTTALAVVRCYYSFCRSTTAGIAYWRTLIVIDGSEDAMITLLRFGTRTSPAADRKQTTLLAASDEILQANSTKQLTGYIQRRTVVPTGWRRTSFNRRSLWFHFCSVLEFCCQHRQIIQSIEQSFDRSITETKQTIQSDSRGTARQLTRRRLRLVNRCVLCAVMLVGLTDNDCSLFFFNIRCTGYLTVTADVVHDSVTAPSPTPTIKPLHFRRFDSTAPLSEFFFDIEGFRQVSYKFS